MYVASHPDSAAHPIESDRWRFCQEARQLFADGRLHEWKYLLILYKRLILSDLQLYSFLHYIYPISKCWHICARYTFV